MEWLVVTASGAIVVMFIAWFAINAGRVEDEVSDDRNSPMSARHRCDHADEAESQERSFRRSYDRRGMSARNDDSP
jgi:hypothetical protein